jgi:hypothetical protein
MTECCTEANTYDYGSLVRVSCTFTDPNSTPTPNAPIDPDTVSLTVLKPDGTTKTTYTYPADITKDSVGNYHYDISIDQSGPWTYRWWSTGNGQASKEREFEITEARAV